jgi:PhnB protein
MHASFSVAGNIIMASDGNSTGKPKFEGFSLSYTVPNAAEAEKVFNALAEGGQVQMPLTTTFFSPKFGMVADKFGVGWMIYVAPEQK